MGDKSTWLKDYLKTQTDEHIRQIGKHEGAKEALGDVLDHLDPKLYCQTCGFHAWNNNMEEHMKKDHPPVPQITR